MEAKTARKLFDLDCLLVGLGWGPSQRSHDYLLQQGHVPSHTGVALPRPPLFEELRSEEKYLKRDFRLVPMLRVGTGLIGDV